MRRREPAEERELSALIARYERFIRWKVRSLSRKTACPHYVAEDLFQAGVCGLIQAYDSFDAGLGVPLQAYIFMKVDHAIRDDMAKYCGVLSLGSIRKARTFDEDTRVLEQIYRRNVSYAEIAEFCGVDEHGMLSDMAEPLHKRVAHETGGLLADAVPAVFDDPACLERAAHTEEFRGVVQSAVAELSAADARLYRRLFVDAATLTEVGKKLGVTKQMVWKLKKKLMARVAGMLEEKLFVEDIPEA